MKKNFATVGTSTSLQSYKGLEGELSLTSDTRELSVHDGARSGGRQITLIEAGDGEPSTTPDHLNQLYVNREDNALFVSTGTSSANDWKLVSAEGQNLSGSLLVDTIGSYQSALTPDEQEKVTDALIAAETIRGKQVANETLTAQKFQADTITSREIAAGTILADNIKANELSSAAGVFGVISVGDLGAGTISASNIFLGSSRFHFDGGNELISLNDVAGTLRAEFGKLGTGTTDYGLNLYDDTGALVVGLNGLGNSVVSGVNIANGAISASSGHINDLNADDITAGTIDANTVNVVNLDASEITTGTLSADFISGGVLQLTSGMEVTNSGGTTLITSSGIVASQIFIGNLSGAGSLAQQNSVSNSDITSIDGGKIFTNSITSNEIQSGTITANEIQSGTLTSASGVFGTISANDITTGTLNANNVNVINLDASNITSGTISADFLNGGSANVNKVFASDSLTASGTVFGTFGDFSVLDTSAVDIDGTRTIDNGSDFVGDDVRCDDLDFDHCYVSRSHFTEILDIRNTSGGTGDHGIRGMGGGSGQYGGLVGEESGFDFYADGSGTNYGPFTGAHDSLLDKTATQPAIGDVLVDVGPVVKKEISTTLCEVAVSTKAGDKAVSGVCAKVQDLRQTNPDGQTRWRSRPSALIEEHIPETGKVKMSAQAESIADSYYRVTLNGLGEGQVNVCGEGGDIEVGDLLETSTIAGKARKQTDNVYRASTLGKAREEVTFASATEVKMIACSYHSS